ncbi:fatty acid--CoA ligase [Streptomyces sp. NBC_01465]|uniref:fatty acid--CoA ligase n=1 Tax=Streptomyces sp. NBC_01465 TaxID=2903878 RepID=UPI002E363865|nr:fatty acid--CoA ligase [Streptomyces sp. NBC_01465]
MLSTMQRHPLTVTTLLRHGATVHGRSEAVTWTGGAARRATYAEVASRATKLAAALRGLGIDGDQRVATLMWNNQEHLEAYLAVPSMGAVLHTLNLRLPADQLLHIARHAEDRVVLVDADLVPLLAPLLPQLPAVEHVIVTGGGQLPDLPRVRTHAYEELLAAAPDRFDWPELDEDSAAAMCYTSGTTGDPKGVVYSHRSVYLHSMQLCMPESLGLDDSVRALAVVPMFHAMAWGLPYAAFMAGASLLLPGPHLQAAPLAEFIAAHRPSTAAAVPTVWAALLAHLDAHGGDVSSLSEVLVGGAACPPDLMDGFEERHGVRVTAAWGMTETSPLGTVARAPHHARTPEAARPYRTGAGRPPAGVELRLVSQDDGSVLPQDGVTVGELEVRGPWVTGSYHLIGRPEGSFRDGWLRTGDLGTLTPDGSLRLTDRAKDVIKSGGEWISSVELENHLASHPAVREAAVIGVPDERWDERPLAVVVWHSAPADYPALHAHLARRVARWQLPERWTTVPEIPRTSVGKFDKKELRRRYAQGELGVFSVGR